MDRVILPEAPSGSTPSPVWFCSSRRYQPFVPALKQAREAKCGRVGVAAGGGVVSSL